MIFLSIISLVVGLGSLLWLMSRSIGWRKVCFAFAWGASIAAVAYGWITLIVALG